MQLKEIIKILPYDIINFEYRVYGTLPDEKKIDMLAGYCRWENNNLISLDYDSYSVYDEIDRYEIVDPGYVRVWYEGRWS